LVSRRDGEIMSVHYKKINSMLLNRRPLLHAGRRGHFGLVTGALRYSA
jgi:hypothetical protein